jgi:diacylglycerol kinase family enzyme
VELFATPGPNKAGEVAKSAIAQGCDMILAAGGDGTINETVNGMVGSPIAFGILPGGTANVLANEIGLSTRLHWAAQDLLTAIPTRVALGAVDLPGGPRRHFVLMAGVGLDARIVYNLDLDLKKKLGKLAYWQAGFGQLMKAVEHFHVAVDGSQYESSFVLATRVRNYGGDFEIARRVRLTDDDFEVVIFHVEHWAEYLRFLGGVVINRLERAKGVTILRAKELSLRAGKKQIYIQTDGELLGALPATVSAVPRALNLLLPAKYLRQNG